VKLYKPISLTFMVLFAVTGLIFLFIPEGVLGFFNSFSSSLGMPQSPVAGLSFFLILASAYMYLVTLLAYMMSRYPDDPKYPLLLTHAKIASSVLSVALFLLHEHYLIYLANFLVDGIIGIITWTLLIQKKRAIKWV
jgi:hypothetical protein